MHIVTVLLGFFFILQHSSNILFNKFAAFHSKAVVVILNREIFTIRLKLTGLPQSPETWKFYELLSVARNEKISRSEEVNQGIYH